MKKLFMVFLVGITILFAATNSGRAEQTDKEPTIITFIYLNGSNDLSAQNRQKFKADFEKDVQKLHPQMVKGFEEDALIQKNFLKDGKYKINPEPVIFYWGDRSVNEIENIDEDLKIAKKYSPRIAQSVRSVFAHCLHDAIWVQKYQNMMPLIDDLHSVVKSETEKGHKVVLFGYSAGSFITYQYFLNKFTSIRPKELSASNTDAELHEFLEQHPVNPTCLDALLETDLVKLTAAGKFYPNPDIKAFEANYPNLNNKTKAVCFRNDEIKGVVNFASPLILFYSDLADASTSLNFLSQLMIKTIIENDIFFLTVNFRNDPLGFPSAQNLTMTDIKNSKSVIAKYFVPQNGFFYNKSDIYVPRTFLSAHMAYWQTSKRFVNGIIKAYNDGYTHFYNLETCQN